MTQMVPIIHLLAEEPPLEEALRGRYREGYRLVVGAAPASQPGEQVALLIARESGAPLAAARAAHPDARAVLLSDGSSSDDEALHVDHRVVGSWQPAESRLFPILDELL